jgi:hypothetical protein
MLLTIMIAGSLIGLSGHIAHIKKEAAEAASFCS